MHVPNAQIGMQTTLFWIEMDIESINQATKP